MTTSPPSTRQCRRPPRDPTSCERPAPPSRAAPSTSSAEGATMTFTRRSLLKIAGSAAALAVAPTILVPRRARATEAFGAVRHVLVLHAQGGFRSHCTFNAVGALQHNP